MLPHKKHMGRLYLFFLIYIFYQTVHASNGLKMFSSGTRAASMGGADLANAMDTSVLNNNPALLTQFDKPRLDVHTGTVYLFGLSHRDQFGSDKISNKTAHLIDVSYASKIDNYPLYWGAGMFFAGGLGVEYENINTPFQNRDDLTSIIGIVNFTPSIAYQVNEKLSLGVTALATYIVAEQKLFPDTSITDPGNPQRSFFGSKFEDADDFGYGFRTGIQYKLNDRFTLGATYTSKIDLNPEDNKFQVNLNSIGLGQVNYRRLRLSGINFPQEIGLGMEYKVNSKLSLAADISWLNWSNAVKRSTLVATNPDNPRAPQQITDSLDLRWKNQYVFALGLAYQYSPEIEFRVGYNYARTPVREETLSPTLSPHAEHHLGIGLGKKINNKWHTDFALVYTFNNKISYNNKQLPFGPSEEEGESIQAEFTLSYEFD